MYRFENVSVYFNDKKVLNNVSFNIKTGDVVGLIGKNGSGKTTSLKLMANLLIAEKGNVYYNDRLIKCDDTDMLSETSVFLDPERSLYWRLSAIENLKRMAVLKHLDYKKEKERIDFLLKELQIYENKDEYIMNYSKGMKTKILLISCLIGNPKVILLDEPFAGLDYEAKSKAVQLLSDYNKNGGTVIITEHNLLDLRRICNQFFWFEKGNIILNGTVEDILQSIPGEGVIEVICRDNREFAKKLDSLNTHIIQVKRKDDRLYLLTTALTYDFDLIRRSCSDDIYHIEIHIKGMEDVYIFDKEMSML